MHIFIINLSEMLLQHTKPNNENKTNVTYLVVKDLAFNDSVLIFYL